MCACDKQIAKILQQNCAFHLCIGVARLVADYVAVSLSLSVFVSLPLSVSFALARACKLCALSPRWCVAVAVAVVAAFCGKSALSSLSG